MGDSQNMAGSTVPDEATTHRYTAALADTIEHRWQAEWEGERAFRAINPGEPDFDPDAPRFYCLDMFPYPSGAGLHVGHPEGYIGSDIISRYRRMQGHNVLHPMGWDAFGLPAEQYAISTGVHPAVTTQAAIDNFRRQLQRFGFSYDWERELATINEDYYAWTQWIWLQAWGAWYDHADNRARPISELESALDAGDATLDEHGDIAWDGGDASVWRDADHRTRCDALDRCRLVYLDEQIVNWCPKLGTVLANEEVIDGRSERGGFPVVRRPLRQWMFRITEFAQRLLDGLDGLDWPESTRAQQAGWIGRSEGADLRFPIAGSNDALDVFTTRPDTLFGVTFMVVAPEHPLVEQTLRHPPEHCDAAAVTDYVERARNRSDVDRMADGDDKTGVPLGIDVVHPATGSRLPIWVADYVLMGYGHGAIMAVPGHDDRDHAFASRFNLPIIEVVTAPDGFEDDCWSGDGETINSSCDALTIDGLQTARAKAEVIQWAESKGCGHGRTTWRLRDWLFSRQRYWGEPFPIVHGPDGTHYPVAEDNLPVTLPALDDFAPAESEDPRPLLGKVASWIETTAGEAGVDPNVLPPETPVTREANTMPGWAGSCWYFIRYCDPHNEQAFVGAEAERYWLGPSGDSKGGVDLYIGGAEHAVLHLLYARFWHQLLHDLGHLSSDEPFRRLFHQGMITSFAWKRADGSLVPVDEVDEDAGTEVSTGQPVERIIAKMSKSLRNVVNPDDVIAEYGADTFRLYEMYMGPLDASKPWNTRDIIGVHRFLQRAWRLVVDEQDGSLRLRDTAHDDVERSLHRTIAKVEADIDRVAFNTAIASMIEFVNTATQHGGLTGDQLDRFARVLCPFAPHIAEEFRHRLGLPELCSLTEWPTHDPSMLQDSTLELPVQIKGKVRAKISIDAEASESEVIAAAMSDERVAELLAGAEPRKVIVVPGKIVNIIP